MPPADLTKTVYSGKCGASIIKRSSASQSAFMEIASPAAAPQVIYISFSLYDEAKRLLRFCAIALRTDKSPCAEVYPCKAVLSTVSISCFIVSFTSRGAGTLGLPSEKSYTLSSPSSLARSLPYSNSSLITERLLPNSYISLLNITHH